MTLYKQIYNDNRKKNIYIFLLVYMHMYMILDRSQFRKIYFLKHSYYNNACFVVFFLLISQFLLGIHKKVYIKK